MVCCPDVFTLLASLTSVRSVDKYRGAYDRLMREWNVMILEKKAEAQETREV